MRTPQEIAELMPTYPLSPATQVRQTTCRAAIVDAWGVRPGERVLEVGCGQGDTTAVLLDRVGPDGAVVAIDPAEPGYGSPLTVAESLAGLKAGPLGARLDFRLGTPLAELADAGPFDRIVLAHCLFYFESEAEIVEVLTAATRWAPVLGLSEWDLDAGGQAPRHRAALILESLAHSMGRPLPDANVRTVATPARLTALLGEAGWAIDVQAGIDTRGLEDGRWELDAVAGLVPDALVDVVTGPTESPHPSLPSWCVSATRT